jgi:hypothetical protein
MSKLGRAVTTLLCVAFWLSACTEDRGIERWQGPISDLRYLWTAEPGIDVLTGPAVPVRAFLESFMLSQYAGNLDYAYPGFGQAVPDSASELWVTRPALDVPREERSVGNITHHILSMNRVDDDVAAVVCSYNYRVASETEDGSYLSVARTGPRGERGIDVIKIGMSGRPSTTLPPQSGPRPDPVDDVFGDWLVRGMLTFYSDNDPGFDEAWPTYAADKRACVDRAPDPAQVRAGIIDSPHPRDFFPTTPASPGWPQHTRK